MKKKILLSFYIMLSTCAFAQSESIIGVWKLDHSSVDIKTNYPEHTEELRKGLNKELKIDIAGKGVCAFFDFKTDGTVHLIGKVKDIQKYTIKEDTLYTESNEKIQFDIQNDSIIFKCDVALEDYWHEYIKEWRLENMKIPESDSIQVEKLELIVHMIRYNGPLPTIKEKKSNHELKDITAIDIAELKDENSSKEQTINMAPAEDILPDIKYKESPYISVEQMPIFKGGDNALKEYISKNLKYPQDAIDKGLEGRALARFVVQANGEITDVILLRGLEWSLNKEAVRLIKNMPTWIPGRQNGLAVPVYYTLPITFKLPE